MTLWKHGLEYVGTFQNQHDFPHSAHFKLEVYFYIFHQLCYESVQINKDSLCSEYVVNEFMKHVCTLYTKKILWDSIILSYYFLQYKWVLTRTISNIHILTKRWIFILTLSLRLVIGFKIYSRFSKNSEAFASEFWRNILKKDFSSWKY